MSASTTSAESVTRFGPTVRCKKCKSLNVQSVEWTRCNNVVTVTGEDMVEIAGGDPFASLDNEDYNWCETCGGHVALEEIPRGTETKTEDGQQSDG